MLREPGATVEKPTHYELQPGHVELLPLHRGGLSVICDYVPVFTDLADSSLSTFDGINGWEQYPVYYAAREMLMHDGETADGLAPKRDAFRAERVKNVRGSFPGGGWR